MSQNIFRDDVRLRFKYVNHAGVEKEYFVRPITIINAAYPHGSTNAHYALVLVADKISEMRSDELCDEVEFFNPPAERYFELSKIDKGTFAQMKIEDVTIAHVTRGITCPGKIYFADGSDVEA